MVEVGAKRETEREAVARGSVLMQPATAQLIEARSAAKGDVLATARIAGISAAKTAAQLIPLCHPLRLCGVSVDLVVASSSVEITARVRAVDRTGVEMEALTAVSVAALTVYDMCKAVDRAMEITDIVLLRKSGGRSGTWERAR